jgi:hypothetical protein
MNISPAQLEAIIEAMLSLENDIMRIKSDINKKVYLPEHMLFIHEILARKERHFEVFSQMVQSQ